MSTTLIGKRAIVVGGGWSGIAAAWYLHLAGASVSLFDANSTLGGRSQSVYLGERSVTLGGKNIGRKYERFRDFASENRGGGWEHFGISTSQIGRGGVRAIEGTQRNRATLRLLYGASPRDLAHLVRAARAVRRNPDNRFLDGPDFLRAIRSGDRSLNRVFGKHISAKLVRPMTIRMNGAEPDEAFLGNFGTNLSLVLDSFDQLADGFDPVFESVAQLVQVHQNVTVTEVLHDGGAVNAIAYRQSDGTIGRAEADVVVLATPAAPAAELVQSLDSELARLLNQVPYYPVGVLVAEYDQDVFGSTARAIVFPAGCALSNAGAYGEDDRRTVRYTFSGRAARSLLKQSPDSAQLLQIGERALGEHVPLGDATVVNTVSEVWDRGLCAYGPEHHKLTQAIARASQRVKGLALAGDYVAGASIEACFVSAERAVSRTSVPQLSAVS